MTFECSESTEKLDAALAKVQGEILPAIKEKMNPAFKSKYADIAAVWEAARAALSKYAVSVTQWPMKSEPGRLDLLTRVAHEGQWMRAVFSLPVTKPDAQGMGSATTYARRFALMAALGIASDDDDDGNRAVESHSPRRAPVVVEPRAETRESAPPSPLQERPSSAGEPERRHVMMLAEQNAWTIPDVISLMTKKWKKTKVGQLTMSEYQELTAIIGSEKPGTNDADLFTTDGPTRLQEGSA